MIPLPKEPKLIEKKDNWAKFEIEALYPGYGLTIGNSLRRVLLSSLEGAAVTNMRIDGVDHEFSTIDGVLEDVVEIMMNLKELNFRMLTEKPKRATLEVKGEKEVKASDFDFPSQVEIINQDCHIMTLTDKDTEISMEIDIEKGIGYLS
ncbi:MAG: DNA-directed RNA polymerase subunit alpha, partial [Minisyncoccales bacterium]